MKFIASIVLIGIICFGGFNQAFAARIDKGFEALNQYDYFKAKDLFQKSLKRQTSPAAYGLATIFLRRDNPFHNLDSAYRFVMRSYSTISQLNVKQLQKMATWGFSERSVIELRQKISTEFFKKAEIENTALGYQKFMNDHTWADEMNLARYRRDSLAYLDAKSIGSSMAFEIYRDNYVGSEFSQLALEDYYLARYNEVTVSHSLESYRSFLSCCIDNPYAPIAEDSVYSISTRSNSLEDFIGFVRSNANNKNTNEAWKKIYKLYMIDFTAQRLAQFKIDFPDYPFTTTLELEQNLLNTSLFPFKDHKSFGFMDREGLIKIQPQFDQLGFYFEGLASAVKDNRFGYVDKLGNMVIPFRFESASDFEGGRAIVQENGRYGVIDRIGNYVIKPIYEEIEGLSSGLFLVENDSLFGYIDKEGVLKIPFKFSDAFPFSEGMAKVEVNQKQGIISEKGDFIVEPCKSSISYFNDSLLIFEENEFYGLMRKNCSVVIPAMYESIGELSFNRAVVVLNDKVGYIDATGKLVIELKYQYYPNCSKRGTFKSNTAIVMKDNKFGVINESGKTILGFNQTDIGEIKTLIAFKKGDVWGYKDLTGKVLITPAYDYAESFQNGIAIVELAGKQGVIDTKGLVILPVNFMVVSRLSNDVLLVSDGNLYGVYSNSGKELVPIRYRRITQENAEYFILTNDTDVHYFLISEKRILTPKNGNE
ncbi:MAG: WG repeat-containing protein [Flavobacteriia bacterium]